MRANQLTKKEEQTLYWAGLWCLAGFIALALFLKIARVSLPPCVFHLLTGLYCPGCGGTRAVLALLHGHPLQSLYYHPIVVYAAIIYVLYMGSHSIELLSRGRWPVGMRYRNIYAYTALAIVLINCLVRNILYIRFGMVL